VLVPNKGEIKSMNYEKVIAVLNDITSGAVPEAWDNCGIQINTGKKEIKTVLVCLEITKNIIEEAKTEGVDLIVTHHPLIFSELKTVDDNDVIGNYINELIKSDICVYAAHTNFDKMIGGNNSRLCQLLELEDVKSFDEEKVDSIEGIIGNTGFFKDPMTLKEAAEYISAKLNMNVAALRAVGEPDKIIKKVGLCTGNGSDFIQFAKTCGCDLYLTGDVNYHKARFADEIGMAVIDGGHFGTELIFTENMSSLMFEKLGKELKILASACEKDPFTYF